MPAAALSAASPTLTVTVLAASNWVAPPSVAVTRTVFGPPPSAMLSWTLSATVSASSVSARVVGTPSSLVSLMAVPVTVTPVSSPSIEMLSSASWRLSSIGVSVKSTVALRAPGAMVMVRSATVS